MTTGVHPALAEASNLAARNIKSGRIALEAIRRHTPHDKLPVNLVEVGDGRVWGELAEATGDDPPSSLCRRAVLDLLTGA